MEIRVGDTVQIEAVVTEKSGMHVVAVKLATGSIRTIHQEDIARVIQRAETDAEQIERLKARNAQLERLLDVFLCDGPVKQLVEHDDLSKQTYDVRVGEHQDYGPGEFPIERVLDKGSTADDHN
jgi:hypothetical protein